MRFNRVLLVSPDNAESRPEHPQLGLGCLCEALETKGVENRVVDMRLGGGVRALKAGG